MNIWTCGSSSRSGSRIAWTRIKHVNCANRLSNFWDFFGAIQWFPVGREWWPWTKPGYITMTRRHSNNQWGSSITAHPAPKYSECKTPLEKFSPRFFGIKMAHSSLIIFQRTKLSTRSVTHLCWWNWRTFWRKNVAGRSPRGSCSCTTLPRLDGHLQPRRNWPTWASSALITHPILRIRARRITTCSLDWKQLKGRHFSFDAEVIAAAETGLDGKPSEFFFFLSWLQRLEQPAKKCTELRGEYVE